MAPLGLFIKLSKVDPVERMVFGVATAEEPDRSGEICDYASSKPYFERWSADISKSSGGKSLGNVREMHGKSAAGKLTAITFDDDAKAIKVAAKIVDDKAWEKVLEGVYTGFSQGGRYVKRWPDPDSDMTRYTAEPMELSLVDLPCLPGATFSVIKADGVIEEHEFKSVAAPAEEPVVDPVEEPVVKAVPVHSSEDELAIDKRAEALLIKDAGLTLEAAKKQAAEEIAAKRSPVDHPVTEGEGNIRVNRPLPGREPDAAAVEARAKEMAAKEGLKEPYASVIRPLLDESAFVHGCSGAQAKQLYDDLVRVVGA